MIQEGLSFNDVVLVPKYSELESRTEPNISSYIGNLRLATPIISSPMDTVTEGSMASFMYEQGGLGIIHRYCSINKQYGEVRWAKEFGGRVGAAVGINGDAPERTDALIEAGADLIVIDVAHGHNLRVLERISEIKNKYSNVLVSSGNIATFGAALESIDAGVDCLRVGIGPGSSCSTRMVAGVGVPQITAVSNTKSATDICYQKYGKRIPIISDGGIKTSGDIVKALAAGASAVIIGGLFSDFYIAAGEQYFVEISEDSPLRNILFGSASPIGRVIRMKRFRGMASKSALSEYKRDESFFVEGEEFEIPVRYDYKEFFKSLVDGIYTGFAYLGAKNVEELWEKSEFIRVTPYGYFEGTPHYDKVR